MVGLPVHAPYGIGTLVGGYAAKNAGHEATGIITSTSDDITSYD
jgi:hypothetical protein